MQEMLRTERIFEPDGIAEELEAYNPLIPDGSNLKATLLIEYADPAERARRLAQLRGFERHCWMRVAGFEPVFAIADEDLERENDTKTSAVHFLRFEFSRADDRCSLKAGAALAAGVDHPPICHSVDPVAGSAARARCSADLRSTRRAGLGRHSCVATSAAQQRMSARMTRAWPSRIPHPISKS